MQTELFYQIALSRIPQIGVVNARRLMSYFETASSIFSANRSDLQKIPHIGPVLAESVFQKQILQEAEQILQASEQSNTRVLFYLDPDYPDRLKQIYDAPIILYQQGNVNLNSECMLAVVGTRKATDYGTYRLTLDDFYNTKYKIHKPGEDGPGSKAAKARGPVRASPQSTKTRITP